MHILYSVSNRISLNVSNETKKENRAISILSKNFSTATRMHRMTFVFEAFRNLSKKEQKSRKSGCLL